MLKLEKEQFSLILIFPFIIILSATLLNGDGMNTISFFYALMIWWIGVIDHHGKITRSDLVYILFGIFIAIVSICREPISTYYFGIQFSDLLFAFIIFSDRYFDIDSFGGYCLKRRDLSIMVSVLIYGLLIYNYLKNGLYFEMTWGTEVFKGPFNLPHTLAYILFFMTLLDLYYFMKINSVVHLSFSGINIMLILLTAVRSILLPLLFVLLYFADRILKSGPPIKRAIIGLTIIAGMVVVLKSGVASHVIEKSRYALLSGGDITNSRGKIFPSSIKALFDHDYNIGFNPILGIGMDSLFEYNLKTIDHAIHAHNDYIDAFTCYGVIGIVVYVICFWRFIKNNKKWEGIVIFVIAVFNGLFPYGEVIPMIILCRLFFEDRYLQRRT